MGFRGDLPEWGSASHLAAMRQRFNLTDRETQILDLLIHGVARNSEIAVRLDLSEGTIKQYMRVLLAKLNASNKVQAVIQVVEATIDHQVKEK